MYSVFGITSFNITIDNFMFYQIHKLLHIDYNNFIRSCRELEMLKIFDPKICLKYFTFNTKNITFRTFQFFNCNFGFK